MPDPHEQVETVPLSRGTATGCECPQCRHLRNPSAATCILFAEELLEVYDAHPELAVPMPAVDGLERGCG